MIMIIYIQVHSYFFPDLSCFQEWLTPRMREEVQEMIQIGEVPFASLIGWVTSNNKWVGNNSNLLERWISKLYPNYVHIHVLKIQLWFSEGFQSTSESSGIAAGVGCRCFQGQLGEEGGRIVASFSSVFTREMGKPKLFIQHCSTWFSMVFPLTSPLLGFGADLLMLVPRSQNAGRGSIRSNSSCWPRRNTGGALSAWNLSHWIPRV